MFASTGTFTSGDDCRGRQGGEQPGRRMTEGRWAVLALLVVVSMATFAARRERRDSGHAQQAPRMHFGDRVKVATVCFNVTNPAGGQSTLYGLRYTDTGRPVDPSTPAIVLVHGIASSTENWDFSPTWSVARALAAAGYVVYSYDRLGYAKSSYIDQPGGGFHADDRGAPRRAAPGRWRGSRRAITRRRPEAIARLPRRRPGCTTLRL